MSRLRLGLQTPVTKWPLASVVLIALTLVYAFWIGQPWLPLVANLAAFVFFAPFLEQRIGSIALLLLYVGGGYLANVLQAPFIRQSPLILGSVGAVSASIAAFTVLFWREKMYLVLAPVPAWIYGACFLAPCALTNPWPLGIVTGVMVGSGFALAHLEVFPLRSDFLFLEEQRLYNLAKKKPRLDSKLKVFMAIHYVNPNSFYSFRAMFIYFAKSGTPYRTFNEYQHLFISEVVTSCFLVTEGHSQYDLTQEVISVMPISWNFNRMNLRITPYHVAQRAVYFRKIGDVPRTLRMYDLLIDKFAGHPKAEEAKQDIMKLFNQVARYDSISKAQILNVLLKYAEHHQNNNFQTQLRQLTYEVQQDIKNAGNG